jgi:hypothetical protein
MISKNSGACVTMLAKFYYMKSISLGPSRSRKEGSPWNFIIRMQFAILGIVNQTVGKSSTRRHTVMLKAMKTCRRKVRQDISESKAD